MLKGKDQFESCTYRPTGVKNRKFPLARSQQMAQPLRALPPSPGLSWVLIPRTKQASQMALLAPLTPRGPLNLYLGAPPAQAAVAHPQNMANQQGGLNGVRSTLLPAKPRKAGRLS